jgi:hypothetical protein
VSPRPRRQRTALDDVLDAMLDSIAPTRRPLLVPWWIAVICVGAAAFLVETAARESQPGGLFPVSTHEGLRARVVALFALWDVFPPFRVQT